MPVQTVIKNRRDTAENWTSTNPVLSSGELGLETDTNKVKYGNGSSSWNALPYASQSPYQNLGYPKYVSGYYYGYPGNCDLAASATSLTRMNLMPFTVPTTTTFDRIGINVTIAAAGAIVKLGMYPSQSDGRPSGNLIFDAGTVDCSTTGVKEITINQTLNAGLYYIASVSQTAIITASHWGGTTGWAAPPVARTSFVTSSQFQGYFVDSVTAGFPASVTSTLAQNVRSMAVQMRAA